MIRTQEAAGRERLCVAASLPGPSRLPAVAEPINRAPSVVAARATWRAAREGVSVAQAGYWPTLAVTAQYNALGLNPDSAQTAFTETRGSNYTVDRMR
ncbi:MAG: TolC family protein [Gammaproteobacteria bacterium]|nr:TolC family protein [Gammaproteobacteria bacterium]